MKRYRIKGLNTVQARWWILQQQRGRPIRLKKNGY